MLVPAPDPEAVRKNTLEELFRLRLPLPPSTFALVWDEGDMVELRPREELEARAAILNVVLARSFGMPQQAAMGWLLDAHLLEQLTPPEWQFVAAGQGDVQSFALHVEALSALAWLLHMLKNLDPSAPGSGNLVALFPNLRTNETYTAWRSRALASTRDPRDAAALLDLYYCLDWSYQEAERRQAQLPGMIDSNAIGQRRWALEWAVIFRGPHHDEPPAWEEVDLST
jgi:Domain of unknown function (DUF4272)